MDRLQLQSLIDLISSKQPLLQFDATYFTYNEEGQLTLTGGLSADGAVSYKETQTLQPAQQQLARDNINAQEKGDYAAANHNHDDKYQPKGNYVTPDEISDMETKTHAAATYQPKGDYQPAGNYAAEEHSHTISDITDFPTIPSISWDPTTGTLTIN